ncbi:MAG: hypothetical protein K9M51_02275 [Candidatus Gracilibacteria bacterium]|nr:hypothetical protein [Candidatus Gracilibacteria bacterium]
MHNLENWTFPENPEEVLNTKDLRENLNNLAEEIESTFGGHRGVLKPHEKGPNYEGDQDENERILNT